MEEVGSHGSNPTAISGTSWKKKKKKNLSSNIMLLCVYIINLPTYNYIIDIYFLLHHNLQSHFQFNIQNKTNITAQLFFVICAHMFFHLSSSAFSMFVCETCHFFNKNSIDILMTNITITEIKMKSSSPFGCSH